MIGDSFNSFYHDNHVNFYSDCYHHARRVTLTLMKQTFQCRPKSTTIRAWIHLLDKALRAQIEFSKQLTQLNCTAISIKF